MGLKGFIGGALSSAGATGVRYYENRAKEDADLAKMDRMKELQTQAEIDREDRIKARRDATRKETYDAAGDLTGLDERESNKRLRDAARKTGNGEEYAYADKQENDFLKKEERDIARMREDRIMKAQERSLALQGAAASRAANADARAAESHRISLEDHTKKQEGAGYVAGYKVAQSQGNPEAANVYLENSLARGFDPRVGDSDKSKVTEIVKTLQAERDAAVSEPKRAALQEQIDALLGQTVEKRSNGIIGNAQRKPGAMNFDQMFPAKK